MTVGLSCQNLLQGVVNKNRPTDFSVPESFGFKFEKSLLGYNLVPINQVLKRRDCYFLSIFYALRVVRAEFYSKKKEAGRSIVIKIKIITIEVQLERDEQNHVVS